MNVVVWLVAIGALALALILWRAVGPVPVVGHLLGLAVIGGLAGHVLDRVVRR